MFDWLKKEAPKETKMEEIKQGLPAFPDSPMEKGFSQSAIKDAVNPSKLPELPAAPAEPHHAEPAAQAPAPQVESEVFVKIDKFQAAKKSLQTTKEKLEEIDRLLQKIKETTTREDAQLSAWEKEIASVKSRVKEVSENIFERVE